ncbi:hypothetical protein CYMTET_9515 [Cymbomonas tetramitiformis]|uniref:Uncharacterized protein n=1 Tax=Cymbomonas tetramitiformis TaxID=36881 RepID=A0AAE0GRB7_9CHLO|nr:hypothetical protein CYMTET_9515 [Cymbomonas tetramitiformis]
MAAPRALPCLAKAGLLGMKNGSQRRPGALPILRRHTVVVSWRWPFTKPGCEDPRWPFNPADPLAHKQAKRLELHTSLVEALARCTEEYAWLDWSCAPQYHVHPNPCLEISNSGVYFREAAQMLIWERNALEGLRVGKEYMKRAWTMAERVQRCKGRGLRLRNFVSLRKIAQIRRLSMIGPRTSSREAKDLLLIYRMLWDVLDKLFQAGLLQISNTVGSSCSGVGTTQHSHSTVPVPIAAAVNTFMVKMLVARNSIFSNLDRTMRFGVEFYDCREHWEEFLNPDVMAAFEAAGGTYSADPRRVGDWHAQCVCVTDFWELLLEAPLQEHLAALENPRWVCQYLTDWAGINYLAANQRDLLWALVAAGVLSNPVSSYEELVVEAARRLRVDGLELAMPVILHSRHYVQSDKRRSRFKLSDEMKELVPTWHPHRFSPIDWCVPLSVVISLRQWLGLVQSIAKRWDCPVACTVVCLQGACETPVVLAQLGQGRVEREEYGGIAGMLRNKKLVEALAKLQNSAKRNYRASDTGEILVLEHEGEEHLRGDPLSPSSVTSTAAVEPDDVEQDQEVELLLQITLCHPTEHCTLTPGRGPRRPSPVWMSAAEHANMVSKADIVTSYRWAYSTNDQAWLLRSRTSALKQLSITFRGVAPTKAKLETAVQHALDRAAPGNNVRVMSALLDEPLALQ